MLNNTYFECKTAVIPNLALKVKDIVDDSFLIITAHKVDE